MLDARQGSEYASDYSTFLSKIEIYLLISHPLDTGHKLNVHKTFRRPPVSTGQFLRAFNSLVTNDDFYSDNGFYNISSRCYGIHVSVVFKYVHLFFMSN